MRYNEFKGEVARATNNEHSRRPGVTSFVLRAFGVTYGVELSVKPEHVAEIGAGRISDPMVAIISTAEDDPLQRRYEALISARDSGWRSSPLVRIALMVDSDEAKKDYLPLAQTDDSPFMYGYMGYVDGNEGTLVCQGRPTYPEAVADIFYADTSS